MNAKKTIGKSFLLFAALALAGGAAIAVLASFNYFLRENRVLLENEISQSAKSFVGASKKMNVEIANLNTDVATLSEMFNSAKSELASTSAQLDEMTSRWADAHAQSIDFQHQYNAVKGTVSDLESQVGTLKKLSETDPELIKKYSKVYFLNENYAPKALAAINSAYVFNTDETYQFNAEAMPFLKLMLTTALADNVGIKIISAYRSFGEQSSLKTSYKMSYGAGANKFSADQGYSEHQLGTAVDFTTSAVGAGFDGFEDTSAYRWLLANAYTYGFVLSYPQDNSYYQFEPWHWRFVGRALAKKLHDDGKNFYDLDQREIDKYLVSLFD